MRFCGLAVTAILCAASALAQQGSLRFVIIGDRTGEAQPGMYEEVWKELASANPSFVLSVGDTIEGLHDPAAAAEWASIMQFLSQWKRFPLYLTPGNHDIWSAGSEALFERYAGHPPHYSFDQGPAHFTVLDNSRSDELGSTELAFLESDLARHDRQPLKFIVSHRPSWIIKAMLDDPNFELHRIARKHGVQYVIAGHVHELLHAEVEGITYLSMPSAGGHLRASGKYEDGWFFGYTVVEVNGGRAGFRIHELNAPFGRGRESGIEDWGKAGLLAR